VHSDADERELDLGFLAAELRTLGIAGVGKEFLGAPHERLAAHAIQVDVFIRR